MDVQTRILDLLLTHGRRRRFFASNFKAIEGEVEAQIQDLVDAGRLREAGVVYRPPATPVRAGTVEQAHAWASSSELREEWLLSEDEEFYVGIEYQILDDAWWTQRMQERLDDDPWLDQPLSAEEIASTDRDVRA